MLADDVNVFYGMNTSVERAMFNLIRNKKPASETNQKDFLMIGRPQLSNIFSKRKSLRKNATDESTNL